MDKFKVGDVIDYGFMKELKVVNVTTKYYSLQDKSGNIEEKFKYLVNEHGILAQKRIIKTKTSTLYCPKLKNENQFVDEKYNPTEDIFEAIGWKTEEQCKKDIQNFDIPEEYEIVKKIVTVKIEQL